MSFDDRAPGMSDNAPKPTPDRPALLRGGSLWSLELLEKMGLLMASDKPDDQKAFKALSKEEKNREVEALIWVHHVDNDEDEIEAIVEAGEWEAAVKKFRRDPRMLYALSEVEPLMQAVIDMLSVATGVAGEEEAADAGEA